MQKLSKKIQPTIKNASKLKIGIVVSPYYKEIADTLLAGALTTLKEWNVKPKNIFVASVAGSFEIPYGCIALLKKRKLDALVTLGCIVKGETNHDQIIAEAVARGLIDLTLDTKIPITFGVLTVNTLAQAKARSTPSNNKGAEATVAALEAALL